MEIASHSLQNEKQSRRKSVFNIPLRIYKVWPDFYLQHRHIGAFFDKESKCSISWYDIASSNKVTEVTVIFNYSMQWQYHEDEKEENLWMLLTLFGINAYALAKSQIFPSCTW